MQSNLAESVPTFLAKPIVYTYTILNTYRNVCPHQMFRRYIKKDQPYVETPEMKWGNDVHSAFEFRVGAGKPLPDGMQKWEQFATPFDKHRNKKAEGIHLACEQKLGMTSKWEPCDFWGKKAWLRGKLDISLIQGETAYLNDLKTGGSKYEDPFELEVGALLLRVNNPQLKKIVGNYTWLKEDRLGQMYDLSDFRKTATEIKRIVTLIEGDMADGVFEKNRSGLCGFCSVQDCENWRERKT